MYFTIRGSNAGSDLILAAKGEFCNMLVWSIQVYGSAGLLSSLAVAAATGSRGLGLPLNCIFRRGCFHSLHIHSPHHFLSLLTKKLIIYDKICTFFDKLFDV